MKAIVVTDRAAGTAGMKLVERPEPLGAALASLSGANYGDVIVQVHASGFTGGGRGSGRGGSGGGAPSRWGQRLPASRARITAMSLFRSMRRDSPGMSWR